MGATPTRYTNRHEAIEREIIAVIEANGTGIATRDEYDAAAIADEVLGAYAEGYALKVDVGEFWEIVARHVRTG